MELAGENILNIRTLAEFDAFHSEYARGEWPRYAQPDWAAVGKQFDGIEIAPYLWERRLGSAALWYYGWDCASGVIWRPRGARLVLDPVTAKQPTTT